MRRLFWLDLLERPPIPATRARSIRAAKGGHSEGRGGTWRGGREVTIRVEAAATGGKATGRYGGAWVVVVIPTAVVVVGVTSAATGVATGHVSRNLGGIHRAHGFHDPVVIGRDPGVDARLGPGAVVSPRDESDQGVGIRTASLLEEGAAGVSLAAVGSLLKGAEHTGRDGLLVVVEALAPVAGDVINGGFHQVVADGIDSVGGVGVSKADDGQGGSFHGNGILLQPDVRVGNVAVQLVNGNVVIEAVIAVVPRVRELPGVGVVGDARRSTRVIDDPDLEIVVASDAVGGCQDEPAGNQDGAAETLSVHQGKVRITTRIRDPISVDDPGGARRPIDVCGDESALRMTAGAAAQ